ncbi:MULTISPECIES: isochorismatase family cysteine hydrolase [unclassified Curtobacterium]|uniref:cysteine hydrolase family protein n=1 Tax=unclassified Curtobacterium TaxID=257496 RepID=UPI0010435F21|nr:MULTISPECIES: isochorismatase family cysteine hydrolase [unclassified Curtobacterium]NQW90091.1 cysteine hydrolase [Curtobacterium sp. VKM Ac-2861]TCL79748.1 nicotinamidase-related amidase [Curtobacterium sp. PhB128]TCL98078.1 nicotinamidase-related amidase [Curtobacterium sp. PhB138]TCU50029.1 nicotinamidase-related amidase [Curtobacterium sp. PhB146]TCU87670.1 nicotinamidase-related amidase [Curtobacterium sp. PhB191]
MTTTIPTENTAVIVVDMQRAFFDNDDSLGRAGIDVTPLRHAIPGTVALVDAARAAGVPVIFTRYVYSPGMVDFGVTKGAKATDRIAANSLGYGTDEIELIPELGARPDEVVIDKSRPSAFYGTRLEPVLTGMGVRNLVVCGVTTNICVETTVRDAGQRDYATYVVRDAVAEFTPERNHFALFGMGWSFGEVVELADVETSWGGTPSFAGTPQPRVETPLPTVAV